MYISCSSVCRTAVNCFCFSLRPSCPCLSRYTSPLLELEKVLFTRFVWIAFKADKFVDIYNVVLHQRRLVSYVLWYFTGLFSMNYILLLNINFFFHSTIHALFIKLNYRSLSYSPLPFSTFSYPQSSHLSVCTSLTCTLQLENVTCRVI